MRVIPCEALSASATAIRRRTTSRLPSRWRSLSSSPLTGVRFCGARGSRTSDPANDGSVSAVINTITGVSEVLRDGFHIRRAAVERQIPCFTSLDTARAAVESLLTDHATYDIGTTRDYLRLG